MPGVRFVGSDGQLVAVQVIANPPLFVDPAGLGGPPDDARSASEVSIETPLATLNRATALIGTAGGTVRVRRTDLPDDRSLLGGGGHWLAIEAHSPDELVTTGKFTVENRRVRLRGISHRGFEHRTGAWTETLGCVNRAGNSVHGGAHVYVEGGKVLAPGGNCVLGTNADIETNPIVGVHFRGVEMGMGDGTLGAQVGVNAREGTDWLFERCQVHGITVQPDGSHRDVFRTFGRFRRLVLIECEAWDNSAIPLFFKDGVTGGHYVEGCAIEGTSSTWYDIEGITLVGNWLPGIIFQRRASGVVLKYNCLTSLSKDVSSTSQVPPGYPQIVEQHHNLIGSGNLPLDPTDKRGPKPLPRPSSWSAERTLAALAAA